MKLTKNEMNLLCDWCNGTMFTRNYYEMRQLNVDVINEYQPHLWEKWKVDEHEFKEKIEALNEDQYGDIIKKIELFWQRKPSVIQPNKN